MDNLEIGRILHFRSEIRNRELDLVFMPVEIRFQISAFGSEMQDSSDFKIPSCLCHSATNHCRREKWGDGE
jgi:hypothetical protein